MQRGKGMKFVGDSRIKATNKMPNVPKDYSEYPGKTEAFWPNFLLKEWLIGAVFLNRIFSFNSCTSVSA